MRVQSESSYCAGDHSRCGLVSAVYTPTGCMYIRSALREVVQLFNCHTTYTGTVSTNYKHSNIRILTCNKQA
jgi:hypothetical protein